MTENSESPMQELRRLYWAMHQARRAWYAAWDKPTAVQHELGQRWDECEHAWVKRYRQLETEGTQITDEAFA